MGSKASQKVKLKELERLNYLKQTVVETEKRAIIER